MVHEGVLVPCITKERGKDNLSTRIMRALQLSYGPREENSLVNFFNGADAN